MQQIRLQIDEDINFERLFDTLYDKINKLTNHIDDKNIINVLILIMQLVENENKFSGLGKKKLVLLLLERLIENISEKENIDYLKFLVSVLIPSIIDKFISIDKRELQIKQVETKSSCFCL